MKLTDEGQAFYEAITGPLEDLAAAIDGQMDRASVLRLHLGVPSLFGGQRLFPRLPELRKLHPRLHIDIDTGTHLDERVGDTLDAAIILAKEPGPSFHAVRLDHNRVYAITSKQLAAEIGPTPDAERLSKQTILLHDDLPESFDAWKKALGLEGLEPAAIDHFDSGQHFNRAHDDRLANLYDIPVESPYSYWFICRPRALESRPVKIFHDWLVKAGV